MFRLQPLVTISKYTSLSSSLYLIISRLSLPRSPSFSLTSICLPHSTPSPSFSFCLPPPPLPSILYCLSLPPSPSPLSCMLHSTDLTFKPNHHQIKQRDRRPSDEIRSMGNLWLCWCFVVVVLAVAMGF